MGSFPDAMEDGASTSKRPSSVSTTVKEKTSRQSLMLKNVQREESVVVDSPASVENNEEATTSSEFGRGVSRLGEETSNNRAAAPLKIVLTLPEGDEPGLDYSSAEEESRAEDSGSDDSLHFMSNAADVPSSPLFSGSGLASGEEGADLSPRSISMLEAEEGAGKQGMEKLLLERLLARKELRLVAMQEKVEKQEREKAEMEEKMEKEAEKLSDVEARLALVESIPGFYCFQWLGLQLLRLMKLIRSVREADHTSLIFCEMLTSPLTTILNYAIRTEASSDKHILTQRQGKKDSNCDDKNISHAARSSGRLSSN